MLHPLGDVVEVPAAHLDAVGASPRQAVAADDVVYLLAVVVPVLLVHRPREKARAEQRRIAAVVPPQREPEVGDRPALALVHVLGLHVVQMHQDAVGDSLARHVEVFFRYVAVKRIARARHARRAEVEPDHHRLFIARLVVEEMRRPLRHEAAVALAHLGALLTLADHAVALEIHRDFLAFGM